MILPMMFSHDFPRVFPVACHTANVGQGSIFVAIKGQKNNGMDYIPEAIRKGASTIVVQHDASIPSITMHCISENHVALQYVEDPRHALALLSAHAHGYPAKKLRIIGITGTKGKTTSAFLSAHILKEAGYKTALLSTVKNSILEKDFKTSLTTPQPDYIHYFLKLCVDAHVDFVVMEVAAQALSLHRVTGIDFDAVLFTNFESEHLEFYKTVHDYFDAKCGIFEHLKQGAPALINADNTWCKKIKKQYSRVKQFSLKDNQADVFAHSVMHDDHHAACTLAWKDQIYDVQCPALLGTFNMYNLVGACSIVSELDVPMNIIKHAVQTFQGVPGRLELHLLPNNARCFIDYAHTPSSYKAVLSLLRLLTKKLIVVFGAGGDRDRTKRPKMGALVVAYADYIIVTSDNPRSEDPLRIIDDICVGIPHTQYSKVIRESDREKAIKKAAALADREAIIAVLGKGPEDYQLIGNIKIAFNDAEVIKKLQVS